MVVPNYRTMEEPVQLFRSDKKIDCAFAMWSHCPRRISADPPAGSSQHYAFMRHAACALRGHILIVTRPLRDAAHYSRNSLLSKLERVTTASPQSARTSERRTQTRFTVLTTVRNPTQVIGEQLLFLPLWCFIVRRLPGGCSYTVHTSLDIAVSPQSCAPSTVFMTALFTRYNIIINICNCETWFGEFSKLG